MAALRKRVIPYLLTHRKSVFTWVIAAILFLEIFENLTIFRLGEHAHIVYDSVVLLLIVPFGVWVILNLLESTETAREQANNDSRLRASFSQKLGDARTWEELCQALVEYPHQVAPQANILLYVFDPHTLRMQPEAQCQRDGQVTLKPAVSISPDTLPLGSLPQLLKQNGGASAGVKSQVARQAAVINAPPLPPHRFDLPIIRNDQQIGVLKMEYPLGQSPTPEEIRELKIAAPVMALALEGALLQTLAAEQAAASEAQRQEIAQHLHDTLAQNISYLRLKLDQLTGENSIREIGAVLQELERMRATADEAYQQVRNTLDELNPIRAEDLSTTLNKQARAISERAGFHLRSSQVGAAYSLPTIVRQQILYVVREALHNIEKHAGACQVHLQLLWLDTELIIKITDDGVGFDPLAVLPDGHYGLWIMQQRAHEIGGTLKIGPGDCAERTSGETAAGATPILDGPVIKPCGTEVTLWVPRPGHPGD